VLPSGTIRAKRYIAELKRSAKLYMPLPEIQIQACLSAIGSFIEKRRPKPAIRHKLDLKAEITGQDVIVIEVRPSFNNPVAKAKWIGTQNRWKLYWMKADQKWHIYKPGIDLADIHSIMDEVDSDPHCCFWG
jgi:hypothetical protein